MGASVDRLNQMPLRSIAYFLLASSVATAAASSWWNPEVNSSRGCKRNPAVVGDCFSVHAQVFVANGTPSVRMWPVGTRRYFGVLPPEDEILPDNVRRYLGFDRRIYGDFVVCPFTPERAGWMRMVCIQQAANLVIEDFTPSNPGPHLFRDRTVGHVP